MGKSYDRNDAERLLRKLIFDGFIAEDLVITQHDVAVCYVKPGQQASELLTGHCKVSIRSYTFILLHFVVVP